MEQELGQSSCVYKINPGFHFQPTALEVIVHYLQPWVVGLSYYSGIINEHVDLYHNVTPDQLKGAYLLCNYYVFTFDSLRNSCISAKITCRMF